jgi:hypothetical protein
MAVSGANGPPDVKGKSVKIEIENNTVVFMFFEPGSAYTIDLRETEDNPDAAGFMTFDKSSLSVAFVTSDSSNANPEVVVSAGSYTADIWVCNGGVDPDLQTCYCETCLQYTRVGRPLSSWHQKKGMSSRFDIMVN